MHPLITQKHSDIAELCRHHGVRQMQAFDPVVAETISGPNHGEVGFLVEFERDEKGFDQLRRLTNLEEALHQVLKRPVDVTQRRAIESSSNPRRRQAIFSNLEAVYG